MYSFGVHTFRAVSGQGRPPLRRAQTLADEYLIFNSDEHFAAPHDLVLENGIAAFSTNSGFHIFELVPHRVRERPGSAAGERCVASGEDGGRYRD